MKSWRKDCADVGRANMKGKKLLYRDLKCAHEQGAETGATSDPHDQIAPQNICETMNSGWAIGVNGVDKNKL